MSDSKMREEFEAWARKMSMDLEYGNIPGVGQFYECPRTLLALEAWQASRAAVAIELPQGGYWAGYDNEHMMESRDVRDAIEAAGLRVKQ